jgi:uncharacterized protein DUF932
MSATATKSNMTRTAASRAKEAGITEEQVRTILNLDADAKIGTKEVDAAIAAEAAAPAPGADDTKAVKATDKPADKKPSKRGAAFKALDFPVTLEPIFTTGADGEATVEIPNRKALIRSDTHQVLNVVSDRYKLIPHATLFSPVADALDALSLSVEREVVETGMDGAYARMMWVFGDLEMEVRKGDPIRLALIARNSYNYEAKFDLSVGAFRLVCENGLMVPVGGAAYGMKRKHVGAFSVEAAIGEVQTYMSQTPDMIAAWKRWVKVDCSSEMLEAVLKNQTLIGKKASEQVLEYYGTQKQTVWDAYNALTWYATHNVNEGGRSPLTQDAIQRFATNFAVTAAAAGE